MSDTGERLARVEERIASGDDRFDRLDAAIEKLTVQIETLNVRLARSFGFFAGISFAFSLFGGIIVSFADKAFARIVGP